MTDIYEAMGLKKPSENIQEVANPENDPVTLEENIDAEINDADNTDGDDQPENIDASPEEQSKDKDNPANHKFKELRTEKARLLKQQKETDLIYADLAKKQGFDGVTNAKEYAEAVKQKELADKYEQTNDTKDLIEMVKAEVEKDVTSKYGLEQTVKDIANHEIERDFEKDIKDLNKEYGLDVKDFDDLINLPNAGKFIDLLDVPTISFNQAYYLANQETVDKQRGERAKQQAINEAKGLSHVDDKNKGGVIDNITVTQEDINEFRVFYPKESDKQLRDRVKRSKR